MSLESTLFTLLSPIASGRAYPDVTPDSPVFPLLTYQQVGGRAFEYLSQTIPDKEHARIQINVWARTRLEASSMARAARAAIIGHTWAAQTYGAPVWDFNSVMKIYGCRQDFGIWYAP